MMDSSDLMDAVTSVTKEWTKQRKAEERGRRSSRSRKYVYSNRVNFTDVAARILPAAYQHASGDGQYPVAKRQLYYASREKFRERTMREITYDYFANLLTKFINQNPDATSDWRITADPRGTLIIPNASTEVKIPCGTIQIDDHLQDASRDSTLINATNIPVEYPSLKAGVRYQGVLYIEKEGFGPILEQARIAERFHVAILSNKGQSVTAGRKFVDHVCYVGGGVPLFIVHDFDKAGFEISQNLTRVSDAAQEGERVTYHFQNEINAFDLGLRLRDIEEYELEHETCTFKGYFPPDTICTPEEQEFLKSGRRVELNAFTSPQLIKWLETRLSERLSQSFVPNSDETLDRAYRRAVCIQRINSAIETARKSAIRESEAVDIPGDLKAQVREIVEHEGIPWDKAIYRLIDPEKVKKTIPEQAKKQA